MRRIMNYVSVIIIQSSRCYVLPSDEWKIFEIIVKNMRAEKKRNKRPQDYYILIRFISMGFPTVKINNSTPFDCIEHVSKTLLLHLVSIK